MANKKKRPNKNSQEGSSMTKNDGKSKHHMVSKHVPQTAVPNAEAVPDNDDKTDEVKYQQDLEQAIKMSMTENKSKKKAETFVPNDSDDNYWTKPQNNLPSSDCKMRKNDSENCNKNSNMRELHDHSTNEKNGTVVERAKRSEMTHDGRSVVVDRHGRINGQNETHLFTGTGARKKERAFIEQSKKQQEYTRQQEQREEGASSMVEFARTNEKKIPCDTLANDQRYVPGLPYRARNWSMQREKTDRAEVYKKEQREQICIPKEIPNACGRIDTESKNRKELPIAVKAFEFRGACEEKEKLKTRVLCHADAHSRENPSSVLMEDEKKNFLSKNTAGSSSAISNHGSFQETHEFPRILTENRARYGAGGTGNSSHIPSPPNSSEIFYDSISTPYYPNCLMNDQQLGIGVDEQFTKETLYGRLAIYDPSLYRLLIQKEQRDREEKARAATAEQEEYQRQLLVTNYDTYEVREENSKIVDYDNFTSSMSNALLTTNNEVPTYEQETASNNPYQEIPFSQFSDNNGNSIPNSTYGGPPGYIDNSLSAQPYNFYPCDDTARTRYYTVNFSHGPLTVPISRQSYNEDNYDRYQTEYKDFRVQREMPLSTPSCQNRGRGSIMHSNFHHSSNRGKRGCWQDRQFSLFHDENDTHNMQRSYVHPGNFQHQMQNEFLIPSNQRSNTASHLPRNPHHKYRNKEFKNYSFQN